jgi:hypothetical protein
MHDLKKILLDLAKDIKYADMYDLTEVPSILEQAADKIGHLELQVIKLLERINEMEELEKLYSLDKKIIINYQPKPDRARIKSELEDLGIEYSVKDNTQRLSRKLQKAIAGI